MRRRALVSAMLTLAWPLRAMAARATAGRPLHDCTIRDPETIESLRRGDKRLAVVVEAFEPPSPASAAIVVSLVRDDGTREELTRFAPHPPKALASGAAPQRFLVPLAQHASRIDAGRPLCIEVAFETANGRAGAGTAEVRTEIVTLPGARR